MKNERKYSKMKRLVLSSVLALTLVASTCSACSMCWSPTSTKSDKQTCCAGCLCPTCVAPNYYGTNPYLNKIKVNPKN